MFTTGRFPEPIRITPRNRRIADREVCEVVLEGHHLYLVKCR